MRSWYAALTAGFTIMALAACVTPSIPIPPPKGPPPRPGDPVVLPQSLAKLSRVCRWAESAGNPPPGMQALQNAEETDISEHVLVYAPLKAQLRDGEHDWWVLLIWHVRSKTECEEVPVGPDRDSCLALLELADLDPGQYAERAPELLARVK